MKVFLSGKPLVSPDLVVARPGETRALMEGGDVLSSRQIVGIEVKKLNWHFSGQAARRSGLDYNSTPPCSTVKIKADSGALLRVLAFYVYVVLGLAEEAGLIVDSLAMVAGSALNEDVPLYDRITGIRQKAIGIGSYGDGLDRQRPMLVFANRLAWQWLNGSATLLHPDSGLDLEQAIELRRKMVRITRDGEKRWFHCCRMAGESPLTQEPDVTEPFPTPAKRKTETTQRGRFKVSLAVEVTDQKLFP